MPGGWKSTCAPSRHPSLGNMREEDGASAVGVSMSGEASGEPQERNSRNGADSKGVMEAARVE